MKTRDRIMAAALQLFNESGTSAISTNHIADALSMSPGNLYYHFRNKEEIIRALFEQQFDRSDVLYKLDPTVLPTLEDIKRLVRATFDLSLEYRFMYRELIALLRRDPVLHERWIAVRARGFEGFNQLVEVFVAAGVMDGPDTPEEIERVAELIWLVNEFWLASVEVSGKAVDETQMERGVSLMMQVLHPFLTEMSE